MSILYGYFLSTKNVLYRLSNFIRHSYIQPYKSRCGSMTRSFQETQQTKESIFIKYLFNALHKL